MSRLTNTNGTRLSYLTLDLDNGEVSAIFQVRVRCADGFTFKATPGDADLTVEARADGDLPWLDLVEGIDLSGYSDEEQVNFEVRVTAADPLSGDGIRRVVVYLAVTNNAPAQWTA